MNRQRPVRAGFTLVELLIVLGIIGILLAMIVPALGRTTDQSRIMICRSNQRNLLIKCWVYANDHDFLLPVDRQLHNPHDGLIKSLSDSGNFSGSKIYYCPSEKSNELKYFENNYNRGNIGYFYYCFSDRPTDRGLSTFFLKTLPWPRILSQMTEGNRWVFSDSWFAGMPTAHQWYKKGVNYVTLDGSIRMVNESPRSEFK